MAGHHSLWGCVVENNTKLTTVERPFRITSALIQDNLDCGTNRVVIYIRLTEQDKPLQIALLSEKHTRVELDVVFKAGEKVSFFKRVNGMHDTNGFVVQLLGYYLDTCDECTGKKTSALPTRGKKMIGLLADEEAASFRDTMTTIFVKENVEINIKEREMVDIDKMKTEKIQLEEELKRKNVMVEKLYSEVEELKVQQLKNPENNLPTNFTYK